MSGRRNVSGWHWSKCWMSVIYQSCAACSAARTSVPRSGCAPRLRRCSIMGNPWRGTCSSRSCARLVGKPRPLRRLSTSCSLCSAPVRERPLGLAHRRGRSSRSSSTGRTRGTRPLIRTAKHHPTAQAAPPRWRTQLTQSGTAPENRRRARQPPRAAPWPPAARGAPSWKTRIRRKASTATERPFRVLLAAANGGAPAAPSKSSSVDSGKRPGSERVWTLREPYSKPRR
mmetsp:Transcript_69634/g.193810  ORF Transcript_69634/g.193810 Transcript_69634/m.193810 type:complete len:229 (-) Transcript_69634:1137-1823(-)